MNKTKIEWADYSWNPIKGLCPEACWYCYGRAMYRRFKMDPKPWLDIAELNMTLRTKRTKARVFVCSTFEIFSPVADAIHINGWSWRDYIFDVINRRPDLTFIILTKRPERIDRPMPPNVWLGVSVTGEGNLDYRRVLALQQAPASTKFVSAEPLLGDICVFDLFDEFTPDWLIVGRLTGHGQKYNPSQVALADIRMFWAAERVPLFVKNNLKDIWPGPLIQEFPNV